MTTRTVTTDLKNLVDTGWAFGTIYITLRDTQLNGGTIYPVQNYKIQTDANGVSSDELAVPDTGVFIYSFELPDGFSCDFELGVGDPITLGSLISTWCGQTILQPSADTTYLRIDTTNSPLTGELLLAGNPTNVLGATPKQYVDTVQTNLDTHTSDTTNPHAVTFTQVGADPAGTDNSIDVTLTGTPDYLTIVDQTITRNQIDLTTDVTGVLSDANIPDNIIRVSANDTTPEYLADKAVSGTGITSTILNPIGDESLEFKMDDHYLALASAGLYTGGILSAGTTGTFSYTSGESLAIDSSNYPASGIAGVSFVAQTNVPLTNILTQPVTYIMVDSSGLPVQLSAFPTPTQRRDNTFLGVVVHTDNVNVNNVNNTPSVAGDTVGQLQDLILGLGVFNLEGNRISPNDSNLSIVKSAGKVFKAGINFNSNPKDPHTATLIAQPLVTFRYRNQDSSEGIDTTLLDPTTWDNAGVTSTVPQPNDATIQRVYMFPTGVIRIQRGQEYFTSLAEAIDTIGKEQFLTEPNIAENGLLLASIAIAKRTTDVSNTDDCVIFIASRFGELGSVGSSAITSLQQAYDNSIVPQITTNATLGALTVKRGSTLDTDNIIVGTNGVGTTTFSVTGDGNIAGANLSGTNTGDQDLSGYVLKSGSITQISSRSHTDLTDIGTNTHAQIDSHVASTLNPHSVTATQVGLGNVDNTSDLDKPVSTAQQTALNLKADKVLLPTLGNLATLDATGNLLDSGFSGSSFDSAGSAATVQGNLDTHTSNLLNPHSVTFTQVGADPAGTDNSTDVTLAGLPDYLTIVGQTITRGLIDLTTDVTGVLPDANVANNITLDNLTQITTKSHTVLSDIGTNTHAQIDSHIADGTIHFTATSLNLPTTYLTIDGSNANTTINIQGQALRLGGSADEIQSIIKGNSAQTTNLTEWQDSTGTPLSVISASGQLGIGTDTPDSPLYVVGETAGVNRVGSFVNKSIDASAEVKFSLLLSQAGGSIKDAGGLRVLKDNTWGSNASTDAKMVLEVVENNVSMEIMSLNGSGAVIFNEIGHADTTTIIQAIRASAVQTGNLTEWQNSSGVGQTYIKANFGLVTGGDRVKSNETSTTTATMSSSVEVHFANGTVDYTLTLPTGVTGKEISIININTATVTLSGSINLISATDILYSGETIRLIYNGTEWC